MSSATLAHSSSLFPVLSLFESALDFFFPNVCPLCRERVEKSHEHGIFCEGCDPFHGPGAGGALDIRDTNLVDKCSCCNERCAFLHSRKLLCLSCLVDPLGVESLLSFGYLTGKLEEAVKLLKYAGRTSLGYSFAAALFELLSGEGGEEGPDYSLVVPLPSSPDVTRKRGFSHTVLVARHLAKMLSVPIGVSAIRSTGSRLPQASLPAEERCRNMAGAFFAPHPLEGERVLLVDDVVTTGASIAAAARTILSAGARSVVAVSVARSLHFQLHRKRRAALKAITAGKASPGYLAVEEPRMPSLC